MANLVDWINQFLNVPPQYEFILYLAAVSVILILFIVTLDLFSMALLAIFKPRK